MTAIYILGLSVLVSSMLFRAARKKPKKGYYDHYFGQWVEYKKGKDDFKAF